MLNFHLTFSFPCVKIFVQYIEIDFCVSDTIVPSTGNLAMNKIKPLFSRSSHFHVEIERLKKKKVKFTIRT